MCAAVAMERDDIGRVFTRAISRATTSTTPGGFWSSWLVCKGPIVECDPHHPLSEQPFLADADPRATGVLRARSKRKTRRRQQVSAIVTLEKGENEYWHSGTRVGRTARPHPPPSSAHDVSCLLRSPPKIVVGSLNVHVLEQNGKSLSVTLTC